MKIVDIEPVLEQLVDCIRNSRRPVFNDVDYTRAEVLEAMESLLRRVSRAANKRRKLDRKPINHNSPWSEESNECLEKMFIQNFEPYNEDIFYIEASERFGRSRGAIRARLLKLELINHPYTQEYALRKLKELRHQNS